MNDRLAKFRNGIYIAGVKSVIEIFFGSYNHSECYKKMIEIQVIESCRNQCIYLYLFVK